MKRKTKIMVLAMAILGCLILRPTPAQATLVTITIEAVVDYVGDPYNYLEGNIKLGDIITGFYTYDCSVTRLPGERYEFDSAPSGVFLSVGGFDFQTDSSSVDFEMGIGNDLSSGDTYYLISFNNLALPNGTPVDEILWSLEDPTGTALSSDALPTMAPVLGDWQSNTLIFGTARLYGIQGHVTSAVVIPEPTTVVLLVLGALVFHRRNRKMM